MTEAKENILNLDKPSSVAPIRDILKDYGVGRTVDNIKPGGYPIFIAQELSAALGFKRGERTVPSVGTIDVEIEYGNPESGYLADEYYAWAQKGEVVIDTYEYTVTRGPYVDGIVLVNLVFKGTGMAVPFYRVG